MILWGAMDWKNTARAATRKQSTVWGSRYQAKYLPSSKSK